MFSALKGRSSDFTQNVQSTSNGQYYLCVCSVSFEAVEELLKFKRISLGIATVFSSLFGPFQNLNKKPDKNISTGKPVSQLRQTNCDYGLVKTFG